MMNPDYNTLLRFYRSAMGGMQGMNQPGMNQPGMNQPGMNQPGMMQQNVLPPQNVIQVSGKESVYAIRMSPNSSVFLMDTTAPIVWLCTSDGIGNVTHVPYDISLHQDEPEVNVNSLENRISNIEKILQDVIGGEYNESRKSNVSTVESRNEEQHDRKADKRKEKC